MKTKIHYDSKSDILYIVLKSGLEEYSEEVSPYITVEYGKKNKPIGIEIFNASKFLGEKMVKKEVLQSSSISANPRLSSF